MKKTLLTPLSKVLSFETKNRLRSWRKNLKPLQSTRRNRANHQEAPNMRDSLMICIFLKM